MDNLNKAAATANDTIEEARKIGRDAIEKGYDNTREYVSKGMDYASEVSDGLSEFVQRQPWIALAGAFVIGYVTAKVLRNLSL
jgi:hypothetical protein